MNLFTTCRVCDESMLVTDRLAVPVHPMCTDADTPPYLEVLVSQFHDAALVGDDATADRLEVLIDSVDHTAPRLLDAALLYASWGWPVFPLHPGGKAPLTRHGFKDASTDPAVIRAWWKSTPGANIGLPTGLAFDVIDVDTPTGTEPWTRLSASDALPDAHGWVTTSSGGWHVYIEPTGTGNLAGFHPGIDYRGIGGYVVAPPSIRADGQRWAWLSKPSPTIAAAHTQTAAA